MIHLALIDYGAGNLHSLKKGLEAGGARVTVTTDWQEALGSDGLILPGVGSFGAAVRGLAGEQARVLDALADGLPCLGICLGMQLLFPASEEAPGEGIGLLPGRVRRFRARIVPQMGWNDVEATGRSDGVDPVLSGVGPFAAYYANSFVCELEGTGAGVAGASAPASRASGTEEADSPTPSVIATSTYDSETFAAGVRAGRTVGFQFHPEKSSTAGLAILANFVKEVAAAR